MGIFSRKNKEEKPLKTKSTFGSNLLNIFSRSTLDDQAWQEIEDTLIMADVGIKTTQEIVQELKNNPTLKGAHSAEEGKEVLRNQLIESLATSDRSLNISATFFNTAERSPSITIAIRFEVLLLKFLYPNFLNFDSISIIVIYSKLNF